MEKQIIFIGGAPTVGKSYLAKKLAEELKLPWISTDTVREILRSYGYPVYEIKGINFPISYIVELVK